jgi:hypothetical protein
VQFEFGEGLDITIKVHPWIPSIKSFTIRIRLYHGLPDGSSAKWTARIARMQSVLATGKIAGDNPLY